MNITKSIPNTFTLLNLLSGLIAIICIFNGYYDHAFLLVCLGIFFDFWDGFLARKLEAQSALGLQLDSLADMVTSGVVPGLMMFKLFDTIQQNQPEYMLTEATYYMGVVPYLGLLIPLASCYRLANFNIDTRQTNSFIGLPTPANALLIMSIPMIQYVDSYQWLTDALYNPYVLLGITLLSCYLLNAEIPLFALKFKKFSWDEAKLQILFIIFAIALLLLFNFVAIPLIILGYISISIIVNRFEKK
ncbi:MULTISPECIES: phosphatidylcholine/phosphatidylserine synthase [unclassified Flavobacterium]|uniref:CDP-alcohol phosphatidyltransferase family protein n=1 Tax=unclassified Flavobacterium TaxID=196869 RepID=UPI002090BAE6|nr:MULTISPECIES: CDP-alcohol phosphatidyltransferase family protein [unclassified Flavobacterium]MCO6164188.1 CDP-alcohol phosphatidyltransferase family protein [Flavobacterium sp. NRK F7]|tara:strand:+ start:1422 stop:2159 length:738 start_codon:yes stop_codon:yes gene_type:complete